ncbi:MAG: hypothetical protein IKV66_05210 [Clostridia bacterium]|nr:hypothetical protein [Clostridia bacterium]
MMYPFITLEDQTEIVHSDILPDNKLIIYIEKPATDECFHHAVLRIPEYQWEQIKGFTKDELNEYQAIIRRIESSLYENAKSKRKKMIH